MDDLGTASMSPLSLAAARGRPVATADARILKIPGELGALGGLRRGSVLVIGSASGGVSLALSFAAAATGEGGWAAAVGLPSLGLMAAAELGVNLDRLALVPAPGERWSSVVAALLDGMDLLLLGPPGRVRPVDARRLTARAREQGTVLVVLESSERPCWPEAPDLHFSIAGTSWDGLGVGHGHLRSRQVEVVVTGRRGASRERRLVMRLPGPAGPGGHQQGPAGPAVHPPVAALVG